MSGDASAVLALPFILPAQAQKHVTHNEALRILDVLVQPAVASRSIAAPPPGAAPGARHIVPAGATGAFAGETGRIALREESGWSFLVPQPGWAMRVMDEDGVEVVFDGSAWLGPAETIQLFAGVGIATPADAVNRLAVAGAATLLTHDGAGHQLKINKAAAPDTASLLFQTGWSGRAEMGTTGAEDFQIRTSADGATFHTALRAEAAGGRVGLPAGLTVAAGTAATPGLAFDGDTDTGLTRPAADALALVTGGVERARVTAAGLTASNLLRNGAQVYARDNLLGPVALAAGVPTGAVAERGSTANGDYLRLADGTQICWSSMTGSAAGATTWTFPAAFVAAPAVTGSAVATVLSALCLNAAPTATAATFSLRSKTDARRADGVHLTAVGRWG